jgi:hypothetical protein
MSNVVSAFGDTAPQAGEVHPDVVSHLEHLLEMARSGEIQGIAIARFHWDCCSCFDIRGLVGGYSFLGACKAMTDSLSEKTRAD